MPRDERLHRGRAGCAVVLPHRHGHGRAAARLPAVRDRERERHCWCKRLRRRCGRRGAGRRGSGVDEEYVGLPRPERRPVPRFGLGRRRALQRRQRPLLAWSGPRPRQPAFNFQSQRAWRHQPRRQRQGAAPQPDQSERRDPGCPLDEGWKRRRLRVLVEQRHARRHQRRRAAGPDQSRSRQRRHQGPPEPRLPVRGSVPVDEPELDGWQPRQHQRAPRSHELPRGRRRLASAVRLRQRIQQRVAAPRCRQCGRRTEHDPNHLPPARCQR